MASPSISDETIEKLIRQGIPGFDADWIRRTKARMNSVKPMQTGTQNINMTALKVSVLAECVKLKRPAQTPFVMPEDRTKLFWQKMVEKVQKELVAENLMAPVENKPGVISGRFKITPAGRRFVQDFEKSEKTEK